MRNVILVLLGTLITPLHSSFAQEPVTANPGSDDLLEEIVVTGSAIKRVDLDSSLPIQVITAEQFDREGITNAGDLIENVPAMQGFTTESDSVGGSFESLVKKVDTPFVFNEGIHGYMIVYAEHHADPNEVAEVCRDQLGLAPPSFNPFPQG